MDLVAEAGIDVSPWRIKADGSPVANPRANPHYCYEWAFGGDLEPTLLCVWHDSVATNGTEVIFQSNLREFALSLDRVAIEKSNPNPVKSRARDQAKRARKFDSLLQGAFRRNQPLRIVLLVGRSKAQNEIGLDTSTVRFRRLDDTPWYAHSYENETGKFLLVRGVPAPGAEGEEVRYVDQFSVSESPERRANTGSSFLRKAEVREAVLRRAKGICECCGSEGFKTSNGDSFLETHHVVPLADGGPDVDWNVVAICPNDHREAHYGERRSEIQNRLLDALLNKFSSVPNEFEKIRKLVA